MVQTQRKLGKRLIIKTKHIKAEIWLISSFKTLAIFIIKYKSIRRSVYK